MFVFRTSEFFPEFLSGRFDISGLHMMPLLVPEISPLGLFVTRRRRTTEEELGFLVVVFKVKLYSGASSAPGKRGLDAKPRFANATFGIVNFVACCQTLNQRPLIQYRYRSGGITTFYGAAL